MAKVYDNATDLISFARLQSQNTTSGSSYLGSDGLLKFAAEDEPRIEYGSDGSLKGLLIEEQRTNLVTTSAQGIYGNSPGSTQQTTGPDGSTGDYVPVPDSGSDRFQYSIGAGDFANGTELTVSWFAKRLTGTPSSHVGELRLESHVGVSVGTAYEVGASAGGWTRYAATVTVTDNSAQQLVRMYFGGVVAQGAADMAYFGFQLEQGSFPTSYIPTSGSQSTRSPDIASIPVSAFGYNQEAGTVVVDVDSVDDGANTGIVSLDDGTTNNIMSIQHSVTPKSYFVVRSENVPQASPELSTWLAGERTLALAYKENDFAFTEDGVAVTPANSATVPSVTTLNIGTYASNANSFGAGLCHIKSIKYYPRRLTDAQLQELTA